MTCVRLVQTCSGDPGSGSNSDQDRVRLVIQFNPTRNDLTVRGFQAQMSWFRESSGPREDGVLTPGLMLTQLSPGRSSAPDCRRERVEVGRCYWETACRLRDIEINREREGVSGCRFYSWRWLTARPVLPLLFIWRSLALWDTHANTWWFTPTTIKTIILMTTKITINTQNNNNKFKIISLNEKLIGKMFLCIF